MTLGTTRFVMTVCLYQKKYFVLYQTHFLDSLVQNRFYYMYHLCMKLL